MGVTAQFVHHRMAQWHPLALCGVWVFGGFACGGDRSIETGSATLAPLQVLF